jgi:hypothetical protein
MMNFTTTSWLPSMPSGITWVRTPVRRTSAVMRSGSPLGQRSRS